MWALYWPFQATAETSYFRSTGDHVKMVSPISAAKHILGKSVKIVFLRFDITDDRNSHCFGLLL